MIAFKGEDAQSEDPAHTVSGKVTDTKLIKNGACTPYVIYYPACQDAPKLALLTMMVNHNL